MWKSSYHQSTFTSSDTGSPDVNGGYTKEFGHGIADVYHAVKIWRLNSEPHIIAREQPPLVRDEPDRYARPGNYIALHPHRQKPSPPIAIFTPQNLL